MVSGFDVAQCIKPVSLTGKVGTGTGSFRVPCNKCLACRKNYSFMWAQRMMHELRFHNEACFTTLTYEDKHLPKYGSLSKRDVQLFLKRLRKDGFKFRYYIGGEYGERRGRPHYHGILFGVSHLRQPNIERAWKKGFADCREVNHARCNYVAQYITKKLNADNPRYTQGGIIPEFSLMSRKPGIGVAFLEKYGKEMHNRGYNFHEGKKVGLPKFYKSRVFTDEERAKIGEDFSLSEREKRLENLKQNSYTNIDKKEKLRRQKVVDEHEGRKRLFTREI